MGRFGFQKENHMACTWLVCSNQRVSVIAIMRCAYFGATDFVLLMAYQLQRGCIELQVLGLCWAVWAAEEEQLCLIQQAACYHFISAFISSSQRLPHQTGR